MTQPSNEFRFVAHQVTDLLAGGGADVDLARVDHELNHQLGHIARLMGVSRHAALAYLPANLPRLIASYLAPPDSGRVVCGTCGLQLMGANGESTAYAPGAGAAPPPSRSTAADDGRLEPFCCPCGARYVVAAAELHSLRERATEPGAAIVLGPEDRLGAAD